MAVFRVERNRGYGNSAESCMLASAPNYTEAGQYTVYYEITYTYKNTSMTENGVAYVWLHEESSGKTCPCGCGDPDCGCANQNCSKNEVAGLGKELTHAKV